MTLNKSATVRADLAAHPNSTNKEIAERTGLTAQEVSSITSEMTARGKLQAEKFGRSPLNGKPYTRYRFPDPSDAAAGPIKKPEPAPVAEPAKKAAPTPVATVERKPAAKPERQIPAGLDSMLDQLANAIALELTHRVRERLLDELQVLVPKTRHYDPVRPLLDDIKARIAESDTPAKTQNKKVVIIGLLPQQAGLITREFGDVFELGFWKDGTASQLKDMVRCADHVIAFVKIDHSVCYTLESVGKAYETTSGMTRLRERLTELYVNEEGE